MRVGATPLSHTVVMESSTTPVTVVVLAPPERVDALVDALSNGRTEVVATTDPGSAVDCIKAGAPDVVVTVADADALAATAEIVSIAPSTRIVAVGTAGPEDLVAGGVGALVAAEDVAEQLSPAVVGLSRGEARLDASFAAYLVSLVDSDADSGLPLSDTEREVLSRLAEGDDAEALAEAHAVPPRMVRLVAGGVLARVLQA